MKQYWFSYGLPGGGEAAARETDGDVRVVGDELVHLPRDGARPVYAQPAGEQAHDLVLANDGAGYAEAAC